MKRKKVLLLTICILSIAFIVDYGYEYITFQKYNQKPLYLKTPDGTNQPYHPSVVFIPKSWNGYRYWMAETPYPLGKNGDWAGLKPYRARWENPCIHASNDGINWIIPKGLNNPIDNLTPKDILNHGYYSDTHLVMKEDTLECWYRYSDPTTNSLYILKRRSVDGIHFMRKDTMINLQDSYVSRRLGKIIISQALIFKDKKYYMWYVNKVKGKRGIDFSTSRDGINWNTLRHCILSDNSINPWHIDVEYIDNNFYLLSYDQKDLILWRSSDGLCFYKIKKILSPCPVVGSFYSSGLYRSCLLKDNEKYRLYFSAFEKKTSIGLMTGSSIDSLSIYSSMSGKYVTFWKFPVVYLRIMKQRIINFIYS
jgi:hypothetical protein